MNQLIVFRSFFLCKGSNMTGNMGLQLPQNESQGMNSRGSYTPTTEEDLDMIQVNSYSFFSFGQVI